MSQIKRQLSSDQIFEEQLKKFRKLITCFEDLSNELFYEIFDYLDSYDVHQAFSNLNIRFQNLLTHSLLPLKIHVLSKSQSTLEHRCRHVIIPNKHRILSLHLYGCSLIRSFFDYCIIDSSFIRLQSIILNDLSTQKLITILFYLNSLPKLSSLIIHLEEDYYYNLSDIYRLIFRLPCLKYSKVSVSDCEESEILVPMSINEKPSTIQHLTMNFACTVKELTSLLLHTPYLQRLNCERLVEPDEINTKEEQLTLSHLTNISINNCDIEFNEFETFIKKICSQLRVLRLKTSCHGSHLDAQKWKQLIKKHMPYLYEFHFDCCANGESLIDITPNSETLEPFASTFWSERGWVFNLTDTVDEYVYSIHPHKPMWFNIPSYSQSCDKVTTQSSIQLTIQGCNADTWDPSYIDDMLPYLSTVPFTHLNIDCNELSIGILIEIIRLLPNLLSLEISSLSFPEANDLSFKDSEILLLVSITSKITKVKLDQMNSMEQICFLMNLCPRMEYLEIGCKTENDLEKIIGCISLNNNTRILYLYCLCLCIPENVNEKFIQSLHTIIQFERLFQIESKTFRDYTIQCRPNKIFLNWKLL